MTLRCYAPGASTIVVLGIVGYVLLHRAVGQAFAATGLIIGLLAAAVGLAAALAVVAASAAAIRRRRAAAGACTTCRFRCQQALPQPRRAILTPRRPVLVARYDRGVAEAPAPQWPHQPLMLAGAHDHHCRQAIPDVTRTPGRRATGAASATWYGHRAEANTRIRSAEYSGTTAGAGGSLRRRPAAGRWVRPDAKNLFKVSVTTYALIRALVLAIPGRHGAAAAEPPPPGDS
jgi:hypothetical protein